ncbi:MAG: hypothetical protein M3Y41_11660 [Pseudomonadota bacterium]|nr:hypothetical protein [Pseudomonadota bacterium]MDQ2803296.1 hypothetical protein [Pseudomonadota bacterium]
MAAQPAERPVLVPSQKNRSARELLLNFESLGSDCEFGLLQRRYEAEPLGLLRWATTFPATLAKLLASRFEGLGELNHLKLSVTPWKECFVNDTKYGLGFHTFIGEHEIDASTLLHKQSSRIKWLRDKLVEELTDGSKIFVHKLNAPVPDALISEIHTAMRRYGRNTLLVVRVDRDANQYGTAGVGKRG